MTLVCPHTKYLLICNSGNTTNLLIFDVSFTIGLNSSCFFFNSVKRPLHCLGMKVHMLLNYVLKVKILFIKLNSLAHLSAQLEMGKHKSKTNANLASIHSTGTLGFPLDHHRGAPCIKLLPLCLLISLVAVCLYWAHGNVRTRSRSHALSFIHSPSLKSILASMSYINKAGR